MMDVGLEFSHYRVVEHIGRGGMADVWSARDKRLNRTVAIKTIARDLSVDLNPIRLFEREARTIAGLEHPHILPIYEFGEYEEQLYIVMRYVSGGSLEDILEEGPMPLDEVMRLARAIGQALDFAHANKVIHLDLKPSNVLLDSYQSPYLADFGLATALDPTGRAQNPGSGTLLYMAPEQLTADQLDHRADIFSFCIMLYHMLTGQLPYDAAAPMALRQIQHREELPDPRDLVPNLPKDITLILRHGTALDVNARISAVREIIEAIDAVLQPGRATATSRSIGAGAAAQGEINTAVGAGRVINPAQAGSMNTLTDLDAGIDLEHFITAPVTPITQPQSSMSQLAVDLSDMASIPGVTPEEMARREAEDIFTRARRAWAHGQGRFLLGVTHFMLISDFYIDAEKYGLELDEPGMQMLLRGALEYDHEIDTWWNKLSGDNRRWVCLHAVRSENAPARTRALERLRDLPDTEPPQIPKLVAQALQVEQNRDAKLAAIHVLEARARLPELAMQWG